MMKMSSHVISLAIACSTLAACGGSAGNSVGDSIDSIEAPTQPPLNAARADVSRATVADDVGVESLGADNSRVDSSDIGSLAVDTPTVDSPDVNTLVATGPVTDSVDSESAESVAFASAESAGIGIVAEDNAGLELLSGAASPSVGSDLAISNATVTAVSDQSQSIAYSFDVVDTAGADLPFDFLSVALEVAASGNFADSYRIGLFDIRSDGPGQSNSAATLSARSSLTDLPSGNYMARLVVNPDWQYAFDTVPAGHADQQAFRFMEEYDYTNNASNEFPIEVTNTKVCSEDVYEDNDTFATATVIPAGGQMNAALCLDSVDFYSVDLEAGASTSLAFDYIDTESGLKRATRYVVFDSSTSRMAEGTAREANAIVITADKAGTYYLALYGQRSSHRIVRADGPGLANDFSDDRIFTEETIIGPYSWRYGDITLHKLSLSEELLNDQVVNCGTIATQFGDEQPIAYVTPQHFADNYRFHFLTDGTYLVDDQLQADWNIQNGDIVNNDWYDTAFPGYAEKTGKNGWRYWSDDGLAYTECTLEYNQ